VSAYSTVRSAAPPEPAGAGRREHGPVGRPAAPRH